jgi:hypothetical protein
MPIDALAGAPGPLYELQICEDDACGSTACENASDSALSPERRVGASDFHARVGGLGGAGLAELDERLRAGDWPSPARLLPGTFAWLPPCDTDRAQFLVLAPHDDVTPDAGAPLHRVELPRALVGHGSLLPFAEGEAPVAELSLAVVLRESLANASPAEAAAAIFGVTILNAWSSGVPSGRPGWTSRRLAKQLGPVLVTLDELSDFQGLRAQIRIGDRAVRALEVTGTRGGLAASIASISRSVELRAGDLIGAGTVRSGRVTVPFASTVELAVERLGKLAGTPLLER